MSMSRELISKYSLVSDQVDRDELAIILDELETVLERRAEGAVVELGCYVGTTTLFLRRLLDAHQSDKELHVYDSFEGLPQKGPQDQSPLGEAFVEGELHASLREFERYFTMEGLRQPTIHKGWFDQLRAHDVPPTIAFALLDGDFYQSIKTSLQLVWPQLSRHAVLVVDDYDNDKLPGVARAVDEFFGGQTPLHIEKSLAIIRKT
jgi:O-methyltransferase